MINNNGSTLIEAMTIAAIVAILAYVVSNSVIDMRRQIARATLQTQKNETIYSLLNSLKNNIRLYTPNLTLSETPNSSLGQLSLESYFLPFKQDYQKLPMAFSKAGIFEATKCPNCEGRFGFAIEPMDSMKGLYRVSVLLTIDKGVSFSQYDFIAGKD